MWVHFLKFQLDRIIAQSIIFHQPGFPWNKGISFPYSYLLGEFSVVWGRELIWPEYQRFFFTQSLTYLNLTGKCLTPTLLLICSSFSRKIGHLLLICSSLSTSQLKIPCPVLPRSSEQVCFGWPADLLTWKRSNVMPPFGLRYLEGILLVRIRG